MLLFFIIIITHTHTVRVLSSQAYVLQIGWKRGSDEHNQDLHVHIAFQRHQWKKGLEDRKGQE